MAPPSGGQTTRLDETRPGVVEQTHRNYFEAGADPVETKYVRLQSG